MSEPEKCPEVVCDKSGFGAYICGRPVKRDGMCGIHAHAQDKRAETDRKWEEEQQAYKLKTRLFYEKVSDLSSRIDRDLRRYVKISTDGEHKLSFTIDQLDELLAQSEVRGYQNKAKQMNKASKDDND